MEQSFLPGIVVFNWGKNRKKLLKNIQARLPNRTDFFSIYKDGEEQLVTYIFNKNLNQLFVYTMPYHYINSEVNTMFWKILAVAFFLVLLCIGIVAMVYPGITSPSEACWIFAGNYQREIFPYGSRMTTKTNFPIFPEA